MALFKKAQVITPDGVLEAAEAEIIYNGLKTQKPSELFANSNHKVGHIKLIWDEAKRIENEILANMPTATTVAAMLQNVTSDYLNVTTVGIDVMAWYDGDPTTVPTWEEFKALFQN